MAAAPGGSWPSRAPATAKCACALCHALPRSSPRPRRLPSSQSISRSGCRNRRAMVGGRPTIWCARFSVHVDRRCFQSLHAAPSLQKLVPSAINNRDTQPISERARSPGRLQIRRGASPSFFAFGIFSKIRGVYAVLLSDRSLHGRVRETHPELAFWRLNGARPLPSPKKTEAGLALRRRLLIE